MSRARLLRVGCFVTLLSLTGMAHADDVEQAKAHFAIGARAYEANQFAIAIDAFEEAYRLAPRPAILFSIAQAHRRNYYAGRVDRDLLSSIDYYRRYIKDDPQGNRVGEALTALADLEPLAARVTPSAEGTDSTAATAAPATTSSTARLLIAPSVQGATARVDNGTAIPLPNRIDVTPGKHSVTIEAVNHLPERREVDVGAGESFAIDVKMVQKPALLQPEVGSGIRVYVDGRFLATTPLPKPLEVSAGVHTISLAQRGYDPVSKQMTLRPGETQTIDAKFQASTQRINSYLLFGVSGGLMIAGGVFTGLAVTSENTATRIERRARSENISADDRQQHEDAISDRDTQSALAVSLFSGGVAFGITATLLYLFDQTEPEVAPAPPAPEAPREEPKLEIGVLPSFTPNSATVDLLGRF